MSTTVNEKLVGYLAPIATKCESYGATPSAPAAANTAAIQAALDKTGYVSITAPGTYTVDHTALTIGDDTFFYVGPGVTLKQTSGTGKYMLANSQYGAATINISSLTASGNLVTAVTASAHSFIAGDYVFVNWANKDHYSGVFRIETVADNTHFTYRTYATPAATSASASTNATMTCRLANRNIKIVVDGKIDYDYTNQGTPATGVDNMGVIMHGVHNLHISGKFWNAKKYNVYIAGASAVTSDYLDFEGPSDGLHLTGPIHGANIGVVSGSDGDNIFAVGTGDYAAYQISEGTIFGLTCRKIINNGGQIPVRFFGASIYSISAEIDGVHGSTNGNLASVQAMVDAQVVPNGNVWIRHLKVSDVQADTGTAATISIAPDRLDYFEYNNGVNNVLTQATPLISIAPVTTGIMAVLNDIRALNSAATGVSAKTIQMSTGTLKTLIINRGVVEGDSASDGRFIELGGTIDDVFLNDIYSRQAHSTVNLLSTLAGAARFHFNGSSINSNYGINNAAGISVSVFSNGTYWGAGTADFRNASTAGTMKIYSASSKHATESKAYVRTAAQTAEVYGWDVPVDVSILATTDGQYARNTNAAAAGGVGLARNLSGTWALI